MVPSAGHQQKLTHAYTSSLFIPYFQVDNRIFNELYEKYRDEDQSRRQPLLPFVTSYPPRSKQPEDGAKFLQQVHVQMNSADGEENANSREPDENPENLSAEVKWSQTERDQRHEQC